MAEPTEDAVLVRPDLLATSGEASSDLVVGNRVHLAATSCPGCHHVEFPALEHCPSCGERAAAIRLSADAELAGYTAVLHTPPGARVEVPYYVGVARFAEGICVMGLLLGVNDDEQPTIGEPIETVVARPFDGALTYAFQL